MQIKIKTKISTAIKIISNQLAKKRQLFLILDLVRQNSKRKMLWCKKIMKNWSVNVDNVIVSKLIEIKTNSMYLI